MAGSVNKVILIGNLGADPEVRSFQSGGKVCNLRIATSETWKDKTSGERKERTEWHTVAIFTQGLVDFARGLPAAITDALHHDNSVRMLGSFVRLGYQPFARLRLIKAITAIGQRRETGGQ